MLTYYGLTYIGVLLTVEACSQSREVNITERNE